MNRSISVQAFSSNKVHIKSAYLLPSIKREPNYNDQKNLLDLSVENSKQKDNSNIYRILEQLEPR